MEVNKMNNGNEKFYKVDREDLKRLKGKNLNHGDIIKVGKYYIHIVRDTYKYASMETYVNTEDNFASLPMNRHPRYVRDFIDRLDHEDIYNN